MILTTAEADVKLILSQLAANGSDSEKQGADEIAKEILAFVDKKLTVDNDANDVKVKLALFGVTSALLSNINKSFSDLDLEQTDAEFK